MVQVELQPISKFPESLSQYIDSNFRRLMDVLLTLGRVEQVSVEVTGSVTIDTGIPIVKNVVVCLAEPPIANAAYVAAKLDPSSERNIIINVYKSDFSASATATNINVIVVGDDPPARPTRRS